MARWALAVLAVVFLPATGVGAHATMVETSPVDGAKLESTPREVTVAFDEPVHFSVAPVRVFDSSGSRVDGGEAGYGDSENVLAVSLPPNVDDGIYVVTWQAVSLDSHPVSGAFVFQVGESVGGSDASTIVEVIDGSGGRGFDVAADLVRWVTYLGALVGVGSALLGTLISVSPRTIQHLIRLVRISALLGVLASLAQIPLYASVSTGLGFEAWSHASALGGAVTSPVGISSGVRIAALAALAGVVGRSPAATWLAGATAVIAELLSGHTLTSDPRVLMLAADVVHVTAAAVWFGGLVALIVVLVSGETAHRQAGVVARFSALAGWAVAALAAAGLVMAWIEVRSVSALTSTGYGWTLVAKVGVAVLVLVVAVYNRRVLVPAVTSNGQSEEARGRLSRTVRLEAVGLVVVLALTAFLVDQQPAAEAAGVLGLYSTYVPFGEGEVNLVVDPNAVGVNQVHVYALDAAGAPQAAEGRAVMEFRLPAQEIGPIRREPVNVGSGHWVHTGPELALAGRWEITFRLESGFEERTAVAEVTVGG